MERKLPITDWMYANIAMNIVEIGESFKETANYINTHFWDGLEIDKQV